MLASIAKLGVIALASITPLAFAPTIIPLIYDCDGALGCAIELSPDTGSYTLSITPVQGTCGCSDGVPGLCGDERACSATGCVTYNRTGSSAKATSAAFCLDVTICGVDPSKCQGVEGAKIWAGSWRDYPSTTDCTGTFNNHTYSIACGDSPCSIKTCGEGGEH